MLLQALILSLRTLWRNKMRSCLTVLGVIIGVSSVISIVVIGQGASSKITNEISSLGRNMLILSPEEEAGVGIAGETTNIVPFKLDDVSSLKAQFPDSASIAPVSSSAVVAVRGNNNCRTSVAGTEGEYFSIRKWQLASGRLFTEIEEKSGKSVCVIGAKVAKSLFGGRDSIGCDIRIDRFAYRVVGVLKSKGGSVASKEQDDTILMPIKVFQRRISGNTNVEMILVAGKNGQNSSVLKRQLKLAMQELRPVSEGKRASFIIEDMKEIIKAVKKQTRVLTVFVGAIAGISLLVGGIGIMNIMLVSVTERTREIGIRMAVGAREGDILSQFLVEAVVLSMFGGLIGILFGLLIPFGVTHYLKLPFVVDYRIIIVSFIFSGVVGVAFGYFPARRAARMNPIDALRHE